MDERDREFENLTDHEYDGIREYDNPCPTWWHLVFLGTAVFSVLYLTVLGWIVSTLFYQLFVGHQILWILIPVALIGAMAGILSVLGKERGEGTISSRS